MANHAGGAAANNGGAAAIDKKWFSELLEKIEHGLEVKPNANYLLLVKKGSLPKEDRDVLLSLWQRNFNTAVLIFEVDDPERDVRAMEMAR